MLTLSHIPIDISEADRVCYKWFKNSYNSIILIPRHTILSLRICQQQSSRVHEFHWAMSWFLQFVEQILMLKTVAESDVGDAWFYDLVWLAHMEQTDLLLATTNISLTLSLSYVIGETRDLDTWVHHQELTGALHRNNDAANFDQINSFLVTILYQSASAQPMNICYFYVDWRGLIKEPIS